MGTHDNLRDKKTTRTRDDSLQKRQENQAKKEENTLEPQDKLHRGRTRKTITKIENMFKSRHERKNNLKNS